MYLRCKVVVFQLRLKVCKTFCIHSVALTPSGRQLSAGSVNFFFQLRNVYTRRML